MNTLHSANLIYVKPPFVINHRSDDFCGRVMTDFFASVIRNPVSTTT